LLDGHPAGASANTKASEPVAAGRFIVQVGAYADTKAAQDVRLKVEKLGLKTYMQSVDTADGRRIRVRVGPFATREEASKAAAKVAGGGLKTVVLTL
jgi:DedD protein